MFSIKKMTVTALFIAMGITLPLAFHMIPNAGIVFLPMHIPVLLCGMVCGLPYGLVCGILTPLLSSMITGMPPAAMLPSMLCELSVYGLVTSLLMRYVPISNKIGRIYTALIGAMVSGRLFYGVMNALLFRAGNYSLQIWLGTALVSALPGILIQIILIPALVLALQRSGVLEPQLVTRPE